MKTCLVLALAFLSVGALHRIAQAQPACEMPNMLIVQDKSGSMSDSTPTGTKWTDATAAIQYILNNYSTMLQFGLDLFPSNSNCFYGTVLVDVGQNTATAIMAQMNSHSPGGNTPLGATLAMLNQYTLLKDTNRRDFVMVITDGQETCDGNAITSAGDLYANGIRTYVIGFGNAVDPVNLNGIAAAGHTGSYYQASSQAALQAAMDSIVNQSLQEICDDRDNNCNGQIDELWPTKGTLCTITQGGCVAQGVYVCNATHDGLTCNAQIHPATEICNGLDDDCDGFTDEAGDPGSTIQDVDGDGVSDCTDCCDSGTENMIGCTPQTAPSIHPGAVEICNGIDDNCNGVIDESDPNDGKPCGACGYSGKPACKGVCAPGTLMCLDGSMTCIGEVTASEEVCDGLDNNCDGNTDENFPLKGLPCTVGIGACQAVGIYVCTADGTDVVCNAQPGIPGFESCNGIDDDCDGQTDEDWPQDCSNACGPGVINCVNGVLQPCTAPQPKPEICDNGIDDDCDGLTDQQDPDCGECTPGAQRPCGSDIGECKAGKQTCTSAGRWSGCMGEVGPSDETCDGLDNDCDGITDEGNVCPGNEVCLCGVCSGTCSAGECPSGSQKCLDNYCVSNPCCGVNCPAGEECDSSGRCVDRCVVDNVQCPANQVCRMGICVPADCFTPGHACASGQRCVDGACQADPCAGITCPAGQYCREGNCEDVACSNCSAGQVCQAGKCTDSACAGIHCQQGQVCVNGDCAANPCQGVYCPVGEACQSGQCVADPCINISCPAGSVCEQGYCVPPKNPQQDGGLDAGQDAGEDGGQDAGVDAGTDNGPGDPGIQSDTRKDGGSGGDKGGGGGGCSCSFGDPYGASAFALAGLLLLFAWIRRR